MPVRRFVRLSEVVAEPVSFLWSNRMPLGGVTILEGDPGCGKSCVMYDIIARLTTGRAMPNGTEPGAPAGVVLLQAEENLATTVLPNLKSAGADVDKIIVYKSQSFHERPLLLPDDLPLIETAVSDCQARLIVIDPISSFLDRGTANDARVRRALAPLAALAERRNASVVLIRHLTKWATSQSLYRGAGSIAMIALARSALIVGDDPTGEKFQHVLALNKSNLADAPSLCYRTVKRTDGTTGIEWLGESPHTARDLASQAAGANDRSALNEAMSVLFSLLAEGPVAANETIASAKRAGIAERTLKRAKKILGVKSCKIFSGAQSKWLWQLPDDDQVLQPFRDRDMADLMDRLIYGDASRDTSNPYGRAPNEGNTKKPPSSDEDSSPATG